MAYFKFLKDTQNRNVEAEDGSSLQNTLYCEIYLKIAASPIIKLSLSSRTCHVVTVASCHYACSVLVFALFIFALRCFILSKDRKIISFF